MFRPRPGRSFSVVHMFLNMRWGRRQKTIAMILVCIGAFCYYQMFVKYFLQSQLMKTNLEDPRFNGFDKCPACFGTSLCEDINNRNLRFTSYSRIRLFDLINIKNVFEGVYMDKEVVLKRLGHNSEWRESDAALCESAGLEPPLCKVSSAAYKSKLAKLNRRDGVLADDVKDLSDVVRCPSQRLLDRIWSSYKKNLGHPTESVSPEEKMMLMMALSFNPEPVLAQMFPASEGWPFPAYLGACGRFIVMDNIGSSLLEYYEASWSVRVDLAYQAFAIAHQFTNNEDEYALYMTDIIYDNFAVTKDGQLKLIDLENVIVVDKRQIREDKPYSWDEKLESAHDDCTDTPNCLSFSTDDLCTHLEADHNYYAVCHGLLGSDVIMHGKPSGLLTNIPSSLKESDELEKLVNECQKPSEKYGRFTTAPQLLALLQRLSNRI